MDGLEENPFLLGFGLFSGAFAVSFREGPMDVPNHDTTPRMDSYNLLTLLLLATILPTATGICEQTFGGKMSTQLALMAVLGDRYSQVWYFCKHRSL